VTNEFSRKLSTGSVADALNGLIKGNQEAIALSEETFGLFKAHNNNTLN
jgi:hypothetical protein